MSKSIIKYYQLDIEYLDPDKVHFKSSDYTESRFKILRARELDVTNKHYNVEAQFDTSECNGEEWEVSYYIQGNKFIASDDFARFDILVTNTKSAYYETIDDDSVYGATYKNMIPINITGIISNLTTRASIRVEISEEIYCKYNFNLEGLILTIDLYLLPLKESEYRHMMINKMKGNEVNV